MKHRPKSTTSRPRGEADQLLFAARIRAARAVLGWSQTELGKQAQVTQRAIYRLESAAVKPRPVTQTRINEALKNAGIEFAELPNGGFEMIVSHHVLTRLLRQADARTQHLRYRRDAA
jgi:transcriptional regulator with XRE-family HTH domain